MSMMKDLVCVSLFAFILISCGKKAEDKKADVTYRDEKFPR